MSDVIRTSEEWVIVRKGEFRPCPHDLFIVPAVIGIWKEHRLCRLCNQAERHPVNRAVTSKGRVSDVRLHQLLRMGACLSNEAVDDMRLAIGELLERRSHETSDVLTQCHDRMAFALEEIAAHEHSGPCDPVCTKHLKQLASDALSASCSPDSPSEKASEPRERQCSWGCHYVGDQFIRYAACTVHGASSVSEPV